MSHAASLTPSLDSWENLVQTLLHSQSLATGQQAQHALAAQNQQSAQEAVTSQSVVSLLVSGIGLKEIASRLSDSKLRNEINQAADQALADWQDDYCGTAPQPNPRVVLVAAQLAALANSLQESPLRNEVLRVAGEIIQKSFTPQTAQAKQAAVAAH